MVIGVMGCMAQNHKDLIFERAPYVDLVVGTSRFEDVADLLDEVKHGERVMALDRKDLAFDRDISVRPRREHAFVTAMRGCNKFCTYCVVPRTRGPEVSRAVLDIVEESRALVDDGVREITLLGLGVWLAIGALPVVVRRQVLPHGLAWGVAAVLGALAAWLAISKPF